MNAYRRTACASALGPLRALGALLACAACAICSAADAGCTRGELVRHAALAAKRAPARDPYVEGLIARARRQDLAHDRQWLKLLHYRTNMFGGGFLGEDLESEADGRDFFLSPRGKRDPEAELEATIRGMFLDVSELPPPSASPGRGRGVEHGADAHPVCRFPARLSFLYRTLQLDLGRLKVARCPMLEQFLTELDASSVTLIFSAYYLNNPASAFGHTFLRFNRAHTAAIGERRELLDYGIDFSADVDTGNAVIYAVKGLTGLFPGTFKRIPFFYKVREYNDYESRDLWEYDLNLAPEQLALLSAHLWELGHTYFDYYYLTENCSYHILSLLEVANPELELISRLSSPVIPADTVKTLYRYPGLVKNQRYRPSLRKQFEARVRDLDARERDAVEELAHDPDAPLPQPLADARKIAVLDAAADLVDVLYARQLIDKSDAPAAARKQRLLERRALILAPSAPVELTTPWQEAPEHGHGSHRIGFGAAYAGRQFAPSAEFRLALHDMADAAPGYLELAAIEFLRARLQLWPNGRLLLDEGTIFGVTSLTPQNRFQRRLSWQFDVGGSSIGDAACDRCLAGHITGGVGAAFALFDQAVLFYVMSEAAVVWAPSIAGLENSHVRLGVGPSGGLRIRLDDRLIAFFKGHWLWLPAQAPWNTYRVDATLRWQWLDPLALGIEGRAVPRGLEAQLVSFLYF